MGLTGYATPEGTKWYRERLVTGGVAHGGHFREGLDGLILSTVGLGTYLGGYDAQTDALYLEAIKLAIVSGCNVLDTAINYRCQRSERVIGQALREMIGEGAVRREEVLIATKGGFIPYDDTPPRDTSAYLQQTFVTPGLIRPAEIVAECHCLAPAYIRHQVNASLTNLGLSCLDVYYLHNPETQLDEVSEKEFLARMRAAFEVLEEAVSQGKLRRYGTATWNGYRIRSGSRGCLSLETLVNLAREVGGAGHHFKIIQVPFSLGMPEALAKQTQSLNGSMVNVLEAAKALEVYVMASASLLQGRLSRGLPAELAGVLGDGTDAQRALQFVRSTPGMGTALVGMKQAAHVQDNLAVACRAPLTPDRFAALFK